jgi:hypothetical protein
LAGLTPEEIEYWLKVLAEEDDDPEDYLSFDMINIDCPNP